MVENAALRINGIPIQVTATQINRLDELGATVATGEAQPDITSAETNHTIDIIFNNDEIRDALNALGAKLNKVIAVLEAFGMTE